MSHYTKAVLKKGRAKVIALRFAKTKLLVFAFVCFVRGAQIGLPGTFMSFRMIVLQHGQRMLLPSPVKMQESTDRVEVFRILQG